MLKICKIIKDVKEHGVCIQSLVVDRQCFQSTYHGQAKLTETSCKTCHDVKENDWCIL